MEDLSSLNMDEQHEEDKISDPDKDTLAGWMAAMWGRIFKKAVYDSNESSTDNDKTESESSDNSN